MLRARLKPCATIPPATQSFFFLPMAGLRIQRMPAEEGARFGDPLAYPYMTVASPSSHDTSTTRGWWEQDKQRRQAFYEEVRGGGAHEAAAMRGAAGPGPVHALLAGLHAWLQYCRAP